MHINNCKLNTNGLKLFKLNAHGMIILLGEGSLSFFLFLFLIRINSCGARDYGGFFVLCQKYWVRSESVIRRIWDQNVKNDPGHDLVALISYGFMNLIRFSSSFVNFSLYTLAALWHSSLMHGMRWSGRTLKRSLASSPTIMIFLSISSKSLMVVHIRASSLVQGNTKLLSALSLGSTGDNT